VNEGIVARRYVVTGRVQGVGYRNFVEHTAAKIGVDGYVRNRRDGSVEVFAMGTDEELEKLIPVRVAIVEVTLNDGIRVSERVEHVRGTPENPMTRDEVVAKARELMTPVLGAGKCSKLIERVLELQNVKDIRELRALLQGS